MRDFKAASHRVVLGLVASAAVSAHAVVNARLDLIDSFVGQINGASAVAIAPNWVITARHVGVGAFVTNGVTYVPSEWFVFDGTDGKPLGDLILERFETASGGSNVFSNYVTPYYGDPLGQVSSLIGFGGFGTIGPNGYFAQPSDGQRRRGVNVVSSAQVVSVEYGGSEGTLDVASLLWDDDGYNSDGVLIDFFGDGGPLTDNEGNNIEATVYAGDSGGAMTINVGGHDRLIGILDFLADFNGNGNNFDLGDGGGALDLRPYQAYIESKIHPFGPPINHIPTHIG